MLFKKNISIVFTFLIFLFFGFFNGTSYASSSDCRICMEKLSGKERPLSCGHTFHKTCLNTWLVQKAECPICRKRITNISHEIRKKQKKQKEEDKHQQIREDEAIARRLQAEENRTRRIQTEEGARGPATRRRIPQQNEQNHQPISTNKQKDKKKNKTNKIKTHKKSKTHKKQSSIFCKKNIENTAIFCVTAALLTYYLHKKYLPTAPSFLIASPIALCITKICSQIFQ